MRIALGMLLVALTGQLQGALSDCDSNTAPCFGADVSGNAEVHDGRLRLTADIHGLALGVPPVIIYGDGEPVFIPGKGAGGVQDLRIHKLVRTAGPQRDGVLTLTGYARTYGYDGSGSGVLRLNGKELASMDYYGTEVYRSENWPFQGFDVYAARVPIGGNHQFELALHAWAGTSNPYGDSTLSWSLANAEFNLWFTELDGTPVAMVALPEPGTGCVVSAVLLCAVVSRFARRVSRP